MKFKKIVTEIFEGVGLSIMIIAMFLGVLKVNAAGADTTLPELYQVHCESIGAEYGISPELLMAIIERESGGNPDAVGAAGEIGLMQIYPKFHVDRVDKLGVTSLYSPKGNIKVGADYLAELFREHKDVGTVLMVYNGVPEAEAFGEAGVYTEYAEDIMERAEQLERLHGK